MSNVAEFKKGFIMRKCCIDPDGRKSEMLVSVLQYRLLSLILLLLVY